MRKEAAANANASLGHLIAQKMAGSIPDSTAACSTAATQPKIPAQAQPVTHDF
jgi:hypothetical protein